jgi:hypothetical protein
MNREKRSHPFRDFWRMRSWSLEIKLIPLSLIHHPASFINECHLYGTQCNIYDTFLVCSWHGSILAAISELTKLTSVFYDMFSGYVKSDN